MNTTSILNGAFVDRGDSGAVYTFAGLNTLWNGGERYRGRTLHLPGPGMSTTIQHGKTLKDMILRALSCSILPDTVNSSLRLRPGARP
jgi:hypothetical protein